MKKKKKSFMFFDELKRFLGEIETDNFINQSENLITELSLAALILMNV